VYRIGNASNMVQSVRFCYFTPMKINRMDLVRGCLLRFAFTVLLLVAGAAVAGERLEQLDLAGTRAIFPAADSLGTTLAAVFWAGSS